MTNMTIPMAVSVLAFLGTIGGTGLLLLAAVWALVRRQDRTWKLAMIGAASLVAAYATALLGVAAVSRDRVLAAGEEKYFCEIDCHLAYHVAEAGPDGDGRWKVTLVTRFDPATTSPSRPAGAPLHPGPRVAILRLEDGREVAGAVTGGTPLGQALLPGESYQTTVAFLVPAGKPAALLLEDAIPEGRFLIGHERSPFHGKVLLPLVPAGRG